MGDSSSQGKLEDDTRGLATVEDLKQVWKTGDLSNGSVDTICHVFDTYSQARRLPALHDTLFQSIKETDKIIELPEPILIKYANIILEQSYGQLIDIWMQFLKRHKRPRAWFQLFTTFLKHFKVPGTSSSIPSQVVAKLNSCIVMTRQKLGEKLETDLRGCKNDWIMICYYFGEYLIISLQDEPVDTGEIGSKSWYDHSYLGVDYSWELFHDQLASYEDKYGIQHSVNFLLQKMRFLEIVALNRVNDEKLVEQIEEINKEIVAQILIWIHQHPENLSTIVIEKIIDSLDLNQMRELSKICALQERPSMSDALVNNQVFQSTVLTEVSENFDSLTKSRIFREKHWNCCQVEIADRKVKSLSPMLVKETINDVHKVLLKPDSVLAVAVNKFFKKMKRDDNSFWSEEDCRPILNMSKCIALGCLTPLNQTRVMVILFSCLFKCESSVQVSVIDSILSTIDGFRAVWFFPVVDPQILLPKIIECVPSYPAPGSRTAARTLFERVIQRVLKEDLLSKELVEKIISTPGPGQPLFLSVLVQLMNESEGFIELKKQVTKSLANSLNYASGDDRLDVMIGLLESDSKKTITRNSTEINECVNKELTGNLNILSQQLLVSVFSKRSKLDLNEEFVTDVYRKLIGIDDDSSKDGPPKKKKRKKINQSIDTSSFGELRKDFPSLLANQVVSMSSEEELERLERLIIARFIEDCGVISKFKVIQMATVYGSRTKNVRHFIDELTPTLFEILTENSDDDIRIELKLVVIEFLCSMIESHDLSSADLKLLFDLSLLSARQLVVLENDVSRFCSFFTLLDRIVRTVIQKYKAPQLKNLSILLATTISRKLRFIMRVMEEKKWSNYPAEQVKQLFSCVQNLDRTICLFCSQRSASSLSPEFIAVFIVESESTSVSKHIKPSLHSILYRVIKTIDQHNQMDELEMIHARLNQGGKRFLREFLNYYNRNYKYRGNV